MDAAAYLGWGLFIVALVIALVFLILWLTKNANNNNLSLTGLKFSLLNQTTLVATWQGIGNANDQVTLYADTAQVALDNTGKATNANVLKGGPVPGSARTVSIPNLSLNTTYFAKLVVTNGTQSKSYDATIFTGTIPTDSFIISEIHTAGAIQLNSNNQTVSYNTSPSKSSNDLWRYDTATSRLGASVLVGGVTEPIFLYNNNGTLAAAPASNTAVNNTNAEWTYNLNGNNRWCLKNVPNTCMNLTTPVSGTAPITVALNSTTQWKNIATNVNMF